MGLSRCCLLLFLCPHSSVQAGCTSDLAPIFAATHAPAPAPCSSGAAHGPATGLVPPVPRTCSLQSHRWLPSAACALLHDQVSQQIGMAAKHCGRHAGAGRGVGKQWRGSKGRQAETACKGASSVAEADSMAQERWVHAGMRWVQESGASSGRSGSQAHSQFKQGYK